MDTANELIAALGGNQKTGMCRCPAHDDRTPSLSVKDGRKRVVFHCHAGCSKTTILEALQQRGLWPKSRKRVRIHNSQKVDTARNRTVSELLTAMKNSNERPRKYLQGRGVKRAPKALKLLGAGAMSSATGTPLPAMIARITDGEGRSIGAHVTYLTTDATGKAADRTGIPRRIFGKVAGGIAILEAPKLEKPFVIGEGVETTLSAMQISGFPGGAALTANNMAKLHPPKAASYVIAADNDSSGRKAAAALAERLRFEGYEVSIALPPSEGEDWNDVVLGDVAEGRWRIALDAGKERNLNGTISALDERKFIKLEFPKRELLLDPWLPRPGLAMVYAPKGEGKTWFALAVVKAISRGQNLLGWRCRSSSRVLYVDGELPGQSVQERLKKFRASPPGSLHILCRDTYLLRQETMPDLGEEEGRQELDRIIEQCQPDVIVLDTLSTLVRSGIENEAESWAPIQSWLLSHRWQGRTIIVMHHSGKSGQQRGTSKREDVMDTIIKLKKIPEACSSSESVFDLNYDKSRDFYGKNAEPMRLQFSTAKGRAKWRGGPLRDVQADKVDEMLKSGMTQKEIARELNLSPGRISQIVKNNRERETNDPASSRVREKKARKGV